MSTTQDAPTTTSDQGLAAISRSGTDGKELQSPDLMGALADAEREAKKLASGSGEAQPDGDGRRHSIAPERSLNQRMDALQKANVIRTRRAQLKRDIKAGRVSIHSILLEPPNYVESAKVFDMLLVTPKYGRVKVNKILQTCRISPSKTVGGLSDRQRAELVSMLRKGDSRPSIRGTRKPSRPGQTPVVTHAAATISPAPQHLVALGQANGVRLARAELKQQVAEGKLSVVKVITECPWEAASMTIGDLLTSQRRWGDTRARKLLASIPMSETKTIGSMTERQRGALVNLLTGLGYESPYEQHAQATKASASADETQSEPVAIDDPDDESATEPAGRPSLSIVQGDARAEERRNETDPRRRASVKVHSRHAARQFVA